VKGGRLGRVPRLPSRAKEINEWRRSPLSALISAHLEVEVAERGGFLILSTRILPAMFMDTRECKESGRARCLIF
jgi:hypothetical protein